VLLDHVDPLDQMDPLGQMGVDAIADAAAADRDCKFIYHLSSHL